MKNIATIISSSIFSILGLFVGFYIVNSCDSKPKPTPPTTSTTVATSRITIIEKAPVGGTIVYIIKDKSSGREFLLATAPERGTSLVEIHW